MYPSESPAEPANLISTGKSALILSPPAVRYGCTSGLRASPARDWHGNCAGTYDVPIPVHAVSEVHPYLDPIRHCRSAPAILHPPISHQPNSGSPSAAPANLIGQSPHLAKHNSLPSSLFSISYFLFLISYILYLISYFLYLISLPPAISQTADAPSGTDPWHLFIWEMAHFLLLN